MDRCFNCNKPGELFPCKIRDEYGIRYRDLCKECIEALQPNCVVVGSDDDTADFMKKDSIPRAPVPKGAYSPEEDSVMFRNIGKKIKGLAKAVCWIGIIISVIWGMLLMIASSSLPNGSQSSSAVTGFLVMVVGSLLSWVGSFTLYGLGQLIDDNSAMRRRLDELASGINPPDHPGDLTKGA